MKPIELTREEEFIIGAICCEWKTQRIAYELNISKRSVEHKTAAIRKKFDCKTMGGVIYKYMIIIANEKFNRQENSGIKRFVGSLR